MDRVAVSSSNVVSVGYDADSSTLEVEFKNGIYQYYNVPEHIYTSMIQSESVGTYFNANVKNAFSCSRV